VYAAFLFFCSLLAASGSSVGADLTPLADESAVRASLTAFAATAVVIAAVSASSTARSAYIMTILEAVAAAAATTGRRRAVMLIRYALPKVVDCQPSTSRISRGLHERASASTKMRTCVHVSENEIQYLDGGNTQLQTHIA